MPAVSVVNKPTKKRICGALYERGVLRDSNFAASIRWGNTFSIFIVPPQSYPSSWTGSSMGCLSNASVTRNVINFWRQRASKNCAFGIINGEKTAKASCWKSGTLCIGERVVWLWCGRFKTIAFFRRRLMY